MSSATPSRYRAPTTTSASSACAARPTRTGSTRTWRSTAPSFSRRSRPPHANPLWSGAFCPRHAGAVIVLASGGRLEQLVAVELVHLDRSRRGGLHAQRAEDALVDVVVDDLDPVVAAREDRHGADLLELRRQVRVAGHGVVDLDADEDRVV